VPVLCIDSISGLWQRLEQCRCVHLSDFHGIIDCTIPQQIHLNYGRNG
jgi:hypothetical protein